MHREAACATQCTTEMNRIRLVLFDMNNKRGHTGATCCLCDLDAGRAAPHD
jgi:hypothetical protein